MKLSDVFAELLEDCPFSLSMTIMGRSMPGEFLTAQYAAWDIYDITPVV